MRIDKIDFEYEFDDKEINYAYLEHIYNELASDAQKKFNNEYEKKFVNYGDVLDRISSYFSNEIYENVITKSLEILRSNEIYSYNSSMLKKKADQMGLFDICWNTIVEGLFEVYENVETANELAKAYNEYQESRSNVITHGGYEFKIDMEEWTGQKQEVKKIKFPVAKTIEKLYKDAKEPIAEGMYATVLAFMYVMQKILKEEHDMPFFEPSKYRVERANALLESLKTCELNEEKTRELLIEILVCNPYDIEIYKYLVDKYGDEKGSIYKACKELYMGDKICEYKYNNFCKEVKYFDVSSEKEFMLSVAKMLGMYKEIGMIYHYPTQHFIDMMLSKYLKSIKYKELRDLGITIDMLSHLSKDKDIYQVESVTPFIEKWERKIDYSNVEMVVQSIFGIAGLCKEYNFDGKEGLEIIIDKYIKELDYSSIRAVTKFKELLDCINTEFGVDFNGLKSAFAEIEDELRKLNKFCNGYEYETEEDAEKARQERDRFVDLISNVKDNEEEKILEIKKVIEDEFSMKSKNDFLELIDKTLKEYDLKARRAFGDVYETKEEARKVVAEVEKLNSLIGIYDFNSKEHMYEIKESMENASIPDRIKAKYLYSVDSCIEAIEAAESLISNHNFANRYEQTKLYCEFGEINAKMNFLRSVYGFESKYETFDTLKNEFCKEFETIAGQRLYDELLVINQSYIKAVEKAITYKETIIDKPDGKKSLFSKLKDGAKELMVKGYVKEYNYVTQNGVVAIPSLKVKSENGTTINFDVELNKKINTEHYDKIANTKKSINDNSVKEYTKQDIQSKNINYEVCIVPDKMPEKQMIEDCIKRNYKKSFCIAQRKDSKKGNESTVSQKVASSTANTKYDLKIISTNQKFQTLKVILDNLKMPFDDAKKLIESLPCVVLHNESLEKVNSLKEAIEKFDTKVEVCESSDK